MHHQAVTGAIAPYECLTGTRRAGEAFRTRRTCFCLTPVAYQPAEAGAGFFAVLEHRDAGDEGSPAPAWAYAGTLCLLMKTIVLD